MSTSTIIISVPSFTSPIISGSSKAKNLAKKILTTKAKIIPIDESFSNEGDMEFPDFLDKSSPGNRKRRLDHLSIEEKVLRKKLKNRVAAQTSRDRKKARLEELEMEVKMLKAKNNQLQKECHYLHEINEQTFEENKDLKERVRNCKCIANSEILSAVPAESALNPLPQGQDPLLTVTLALVLLYLSLMTSFQMKICWMNWPKVCYEKLRQKKCSQMIYSQEQQKKNHLRWWGKHQKSWNPYQITSQIPKE